MPTVALRRPLLAALCLAGAVLACARAEIPITPVISEFATPVPVPASATPPVSPTAEVLAPTATSAPTEVPSSTPAPAEATQPPATTAAPSDTAGAPATPTQTAVPTLAAIPDQAALTQRFAVTVEGDTPFGEPSYLIDSKPLTWASLRSGQGSWIFNLGSAQAVVGVRLVAHADKGQFTTLLGIDLSSDGTSWTPIYTASGTCGDVAGCEVVAQDTPVDFAFGPVTAQYVRLRGGPTYFALSEAQVAVMP